jgi:hypothetical protein
MTTFRQIVNEMDERNMAQLAEQAFDQYEFDSRVEITMDNYDLIRRVFIDGFIKGRES